MLLKRIVTKGYITGALKVNLNHRQLVRWSIMQKKTQKKQKNKVMHLEKRFLMPINSVVSYADVKPSIFPTFITHQFSCCTCFEMKETVSESCTQSSPSNSQLKMIYQFIYCPLLTF